MRASVFRKHVTKDLSAYCQGELTAEAARQVREHLENCEHCRTEYAEVRLGLKLAAQLRTVSAPTDLWRGVSENLMAPPTRPAVGWKYAWATIGILLVVLSGVLIARRDAGRKESLAQRENSVPGFSSAKPDLFTPKPATSTVKAPAHRKAESAAALAWEVARLTGTPQIGETKISERGKLKIGEWLETDNASRAKISVAEIGYVEIDPNSRVRLVETKNTEHRISLAQGKLSAVILAPPRLFIVDTPSATAIDLGCAYSLEVDEWGASVLTVTSGWVSFVRDGHESFIPAGAMCATQKGIGVGTPYYADATAAFKTALHSLDFDRGAKWTHLLGVILSEAREVDSLTLWHLLGRRYGEQTASLRGRVYDRLVALAEPPSGITRAGIIKGDHKMLTLWWEEKIR